jgi:hypothetical protein
LHELLEQAPIDNHLVFHELHRLMEAEAAEASQLARVHSSAVIATLAWALDQVLEAEEELELELVPEEALALLWVQVIMHVAEVVVALAWVLALDRKREVEVVASWAFALVEELERVLALGPALELELGLVVLAVDSSPSNSSQTQEQVEEERYLSPQPAAAVTQTAHNANVAVEKTTQQISMLAPNQETGANSLLTTHALSPHQPCHHHPHHYYQKTVTLSHYLIPSFPPPDPLALSCRHPLPLLLSLHHHHQPPSHQFSFPKTQ